MIRRLVFILAAGLALASPAPALAQTPEPSFSAVGTQSQRVVKVIDDYPRRRPFVAGSYYSSEADGNSSVQVINGRLYAMSAEVTEPITIDQLAVNVVTLQANSSCILGAWQHNGTNQPGPLIAQTGKVGTTVGNTQAGTITAQVLMPGRYWWSTICYATGTTPTLTSVTQAVANEQSITIGAPDMGAFNGSVNAASGIYADVTIADATAWAAYTLPSTFPTATVNRSTGTPRVAFRASVVVGQ